MLYENYLWFVAFDQASNLVEKNAKKSAVAFDVTGNSYKQVRIPPSSKNMW